MKTKDYLSLKVRRGRGGEKVGREVKRVRGGGGRVGRGERGTKTYCKRKIYSKLFLSHLLLLPYEVLSPPSQLYKDSPPNPTWLPLHSILSSPRQHSAGEQTSGHRLDVFFVSYSEKGTAGNNEAGWGGLWIAADFQN